MKQALLLLICSLLIIAAKSQQASEEKAVLQVINEFFTHLESQDSVAFRQLHVKDSRFYVIAERNDTIRTFSREVNSFSFNKAEILKERMREKEVKVHVEGKIATVWAPYDLWVNDAFSHCGVDAFTLLKSAEGWKIASCSYTMETKNCRK